MPVKLVMKVVFTALGAIGLSKGTVDLSPNVEGDISATLQQTVATISGNTVPTPRAAWDKQLSAEAEKDRLIDKIGRMVDSDDKYEEATIDDMLAEERPRQEAIPRNTKKRMYEGEPVRDEL